MPICRNLGRIRRADGADERQPMDARRDETRGDTMDDGGAHRALQWTAQKPTARFKDSHPANDLSSLHGCPVWRERHPVSFGTCLKRELITCALISTILAIWVGVPKKLLPCAREFLKSGSELRRESQYCVPFGLYFVSSK